MSLSFVKEPTDASITALVALQGDPELARQASYGLGAYGYELLFARRTSSRTGVHVAAHRSAHSNRV